MNSFRSTSLVRISRVVTGPHSVRSAFEEPTGDGAQPGGSDATPGRRAGRRVQASAPSSPFRLFLSSSPAPTSAPASRSSSDGTHAVAHELQLTPPAAFAPGQAREQLPDRGHRHDLLRRHARLLPAAQGQSPLCSGARAERRVGRSRFFGAPGTADAESQRSAWGRCWGSTSSRRTRSGSSCCLVASTSAWDDAGGQSRVRTKVASCSLASRQIRLCPPDEALLGAGSVALQSPATHRSATRQCTCWDAVGRGPRDPLSQAEHQVSQRRAAED